MGEVAKSDAIVVGPAGVPVRIIAGTQIPGHLLLAYRDAVGEGEEEVARDPALAGSLSRSELLALKRDELNEKAAELGVEGPDQLPSKEAVVDAIGVA